MTGRTRSSARRSRSSFPISRRPAAIVAALTTSIPEAPGSGRTWDYRYLLVARRLFRGEGAESPGRIEDDGGIYFLHPGHCFRGDAASGLWRGADQFPGGDHRPRSRRLSRRRTRPHRQCRRRSDPARHFRQHHSRGDSDVLRPAPAAHGRRKPVHSAGIARAQGGEIRLRARRRHLGISRAHRGPHLFGGDVLGRVQPACRHRLTSRTASQSREMVGGRGQSPDHSARARLEREARRFHGGIRRRGPRCERSPSARDRADRAKRSPLHQHRRRPSRRICVAGST